MTHICWRCLRGQSAQRAADEVGVYESYQAVLQTLMVVSTLSIGFVITGALISGLSDANEDKMLEFVAQSQSAFMFAFTSLGISFLISVVGAQIHALPGRQDMSGRATRFFVCVSPLILVAELCCPFWSGLSTLDYMETYVKMVFVDPSAQLCPGGALTDSIHDMTKNRFCAIVAADFYDAALSNAMCRSPQIPPRAFNASDTKSWVCSQLDYMSIAKGKARFWFGWGLETAFKKQPAYEVYEAAARTNAWSLGYVAWTAEEISNEQPARKTMLSMVENNANMLSDEICHVDIAKELAEGECNVTESSKTKPSTSCSTALLALHSADRCSGEHNDDLLKCYRACTNLHYPFDSKIMKWLFKQQLAKEDEHLGIEDTHLAIETAFDPIADKFKILKVGLEIAMVVRVCFTLFSLAYTFWNYSFPDRGDPNDPDNEYGVIDEGEEENEADEDELAA